MEPTLVSTDEIREILARRIDHQKQAVGIVVGVIEPNGRRVVGYGNLAKSDPRTVGGDTVFEIGSVTKVFTSLLLADMVKRKEVTVDDPAAKYLPEHVRMPERISRRPISLLLRFLLNSFTASNRRLSSATKSRFTPRGLPIQA